jgi:hypothetical protein
LPRNMNFRGALQCDCRPHINSYSGLYGTVFGQGQDARTRYDPSQRKEDVRTPARPILKRSDASLRLFQVILGHHPSASQPCQAISECNFRVSRQAIRNVTRGYMHCSCHSAGGSGGIPADFPVVLTVAPMSDRWSAGHVHPQTQLMAIQIVHGLHRLSRIVALPTHQLAHVRPVLLLDVSVVVLLVRSSAGELDIVLSKPTAHGPVEKLRPPAIVMS